MGVFGFYQPGFPTQTLLARKNYNDKIINTGAEIVL